MRASEHFFEAFVTHKNLSDSDTCVHLGNLSTCGSFRGCNVLDVFITHHFVPLRCHAVVVLFDLCLSLASISWVPGMTMDDEGVPSISAQTDDAHHYRWSSQLARTDLG